MLGRGLDVAPGMGERGQIEMRAAHFVARAERSEGLKGGTRMGGGDAGRAVHDRRAHRRP